MEICKLHENHVFYRMIYTVTGGLGKARHPPINKTTCFLVELSNCEFKLNPRANVRNLSKPRILSYNSYGYRYTFAWFGIKLVNLKPRKTTCFHVEFINFAAKSNSRGTLQNQRTPCILSYNMHAYKSKFADLRYSWKT